ncbi:MAG: BrnT family toxin [Acidobacteriia bacterium]|nr:BrnT family toxin [Terriglobia bacterium]
MILFDWNDKKAASNQRKHGITFEDATLVFDDPFALAEQDRIEGGECRWQTIGAVEEVVILVVAHTVEEAGRDEIIRIISARRATRKERTRYEQSRQKDSY